VTKSLLQQTLGDTGYFAGDGRVWSTRDARVGLVYC